MLTYFQLDDKIPRHGRAGQRSWPGQGEEEAASIPDWVELRRAMLGLWDGRLRRAAALVSVEQTFDNLPSNETIICVGWCRVSLASSVWTKREHQCGGGRWCWCLLWCALVVRSLPWLDSWPGLPELAARCNLHANALPCRKPSFIKPRPLQAPPAPSEKAVEP
ncbi:hypothetical protein KCU85_g269, partial [Aureobasidium melanogenum]